MILLAAGIVFTIASSWWLAANGSSRTQESFLARGRGQTFWCITQRAWGVTRWATSPAGEGSLGAPVDVPSWVMPGAGEDQICETDAFGWPLRAMYEHRVLTRIPGIGFSTQPSDSYEMNPGTRDYRRLPLGRIWLGLAVDAAFWTLVFAALWIGMLWLKATVARRRGLCLSCGYDRRGLAADAICPECGSAPRGRGASLA